MLHATCNHGVEESEGWSSPKLAEPLEGRWQRVVAVTLDNPRAAVLRAGCPDVRSEAGCMASGGSARLILPSRRRIIC